MVMLPPVHCGTIFATNALILPQRRQRRKTRPRSAPPRSRALRIRAWPRAEAPDLRSGVLDGGSSDLGADAWVGSVGG